tara:strand:+ start:492 stop:662 length:171 start_codon:yes stop_codon:yes gene_type:complete
VSDQIAELVAKLDGLIIRVSIGTGYSELRNSERVTAFKINKIISEIKQLESDSKIK